MLAEPYHYDYTDHNLIVCKRKVDSSCHQWSSILCFSMIIRSISRWVHGTKIRIAECRVFVSDSLIIGLSPNLTIHVIRHRYLKVTPSVTLKRHSQVLVASDPLLAVSHGDVGCRNICTGNDVPFLWRFTSKHNLLVRI